MVKMKHFDSMDEMEQSDWLKNLEDTFSKNKWPSDCERCRITEQTNGSSVRLDMIKKDKILKKYREDYLVVGGVLDNVCNSACISCNEKLSTKIGSLYSKDYYKINNTKKFTTLPAERIVEIDISGGEPTASKNYKELLCNLPPSVRVVRLNTNCSLYFEEIEMLLRKKITVILTVSLDGIEKIHDYLRWPIKFSSLEKNINNYIEVAKKYKNLTINTWTTLSCLNILDMPNIINFTEKKNLQHDFGPISIPEVLDIRYSNKFTNTFKEQFRYSSDLIFKKLSDNCATHRDNQAELEIFLQKQDRVRKINSSNYFNL
jgi:MoaA/NifB/PqqE/SkfB family radical SAM enzyme